MRNQAHCRCQDYELPGGSHPSGWYLLAEAVVLTVTFLILFYGLPLVMAALAS